MDFFKISTKEARGGVIEVSADLIVGRSNDFMVRGQSFYAIWDEANKIWTTDEYAVVRIVDGELKAYADKLEANGAPVHVKWLSSFDTNRWNQFRKYMKNVGDNSKQLDEKLTFANTEVKKSDHVSKCLPYSLVPGEHKAWDEIVSTLYAPEERQKIEWGIGAVVSGDSRKIQKFMVFYGDPGTGKGTILQIIEQLFEGYTTVFDAASLVGSNSNFATEPFKENPLVAIQHDGDLSKIEDNSKLNSIVSHENMRLNEKFKPTYTTKINSFLFLGTNEPVRITNSRSGIIRRLIDVNPSGVTLDFDRYNILMTQVKFELGAIAHHCLEVYNSMGKNYYGKYVPTSMMYKTDTFFNFIDEHREVFEAEDGVKLRRAWDMYNEYCEYAKLKYKLQLNKFRDEMSAYFYEFHDRITIDGTQVRSYFKGFKTDKYMNQMPPKMMDIELAPPLVLDETVSLLDDLYSDLPAQYANASQNPVKYWTDEERLIRGKMQKPRPSQICNTVLSDLDTSKLHFVKIPEDHIVIDFDITGDDGVKSLEANLEAASLWPSTYTELSKSGLGVHLHYIYTGGDPGDLAAEYSDGIEIKVYRGNASLRRKLTKCNNIPVADINSGLPFKEKKPVLDKQTIQSERGLRDLINRNLNKGVFPATKPSVDFIEKILHDAYMSGMVYDVTDMKPQIMAFANNSSNQSLQCLRAVQRMKFKTDDSVKEHVPENTDSPVVIYDVEVFPNLFVVCWMYEDAEGVDNVVRMINPTPRDVEGLFRYKLVGFNNRNYDNHILWAAYMGANNRQLYELSQRIIDKKTSHQAKFGEAYKLSYADIYEYSSIKKGLKKFQIDLGLHHQEMNLPWDEDVPLDKWVEVADYCANDVVSTRDVYRDRKQDLVARRILADLSGLSINDTTRMHAERIIFGNEKKPQSRFVYTDLSVQFPGYKFDKFSKTDKSTYRGDVVGEGGYVYAEPGMYENVAVLDVASMHPHSIKELNLFGDEYTPNFVALMDARIAIKHGDFDLARTMLDGRLAPYLEDTSEAKALADALKLVINSIYGFTAATFPNPFRDDRNIDNIVAKRGALFMIDLKNFVQELGFQVVHIKTDSIKIPGADKELIAQVMAFGEKYGYQFEHEDTYKKMCLVNDAVYIAYVDEKTEKGKVVDAHWSATGAQFKHPYVFKKLFTGEPIEFDDYCETKQVQAPAAIYLDFDAVNKPMYAYEGMHFVGRTGSFVPVHESAGGGVMVRVADGKQHAVGGTSGYFWVEAEMMRHRINTAIESGEVEMEQDSIDLSYFDSLCDKAIDNISNWGDFHEFVKVA